MAERTPTREDLLRLARRHFLRGRKLEVQTLAEELGVSRATAYRWAGNADRLAGEVIAGETPDIDAAVEILKVLLGHTAGT